MSVLRIFLLFGVAIAGWFLFNNGLDVVQKELLNIDALLNLAACSDSNTQFTTPEMLLMHQNGVKFAAMGALLCLAFAIFGLA